MGDAGAEVGGKACWACTCKIFTGEKSEEGCIVFTEGGGEDCSGIEEVRCFVVDLPVGKEERNDVAGSEVVPGFDVRVYFLARWEEEVAVDTVADALIQLQERECFSTTVLTAGRKIAVTG